MASRKTPSDPVAERLADAKEAADVQAIEDAMRLHPEYQREGWAKKHMEILRRALQVITTPSRVIGMIVELLSLVNNKNLMRTAARHPNLSPPTDPSGQRAWHLLFLYNAQDAFAALLKHELYRLEEPDLIATIVEKYSTDLSAKVITETLKPTTMLSFKGFHADTQQARWKYDFPMYVELYPYDLMISTDYIYGRDGAFKGSSRLMPQDGRNVYTMRKKESNYAKYIYPEAIRTTKEVSGRVPDIAQYWNPADVPKTFKEFLQLNDQQAKVGARVRTQHAPASRTFRLGAATDPAAFLATKKDQDLMGKIGEGLQLLPTKERRLFAAYCAEQILPRWEAKYPKDKRPRLAIQAAKAYAEGELPIEALSLANRAVQEAVNLTGYPAADAGMASWHASIRLQNDPEAVSARFGANRALSFAVDAVDARSERGATPKQFAFMRKCHEHLVGLFRQSFAEAGREAIEHGFLPFAGKTIDVVRATMVREQVRQRLTDLLQLKLSESARERIETALAELAEATDARVWYETANRQVPLKKRWQVAMVYWEADDAELLAMLAGRLEGTSAPRKRGDKLTRSKVGAKPKFSNPTTTPEQLERLIKRDPRALSNPNIAAPTLALYARYHPAEVEANASLTLISLEAPEAYNRIMGELSEGWISLANKDPVAVEASPAMARIAVDDPAAYVRLQAALIYGWRVAAVETLHTQCRANFIADCIERGLPDLKAFPTTLAVVKAAIEAIRYYANSEDEEGWHWPEGHKAHKALQEKIQAEIDWPRPGLVAYRPNTILYAARSALDMGIASSMPAYHMSHFVKEDEKAHSSRDWNPTPRYLRELQWQADRVRHYYGIEYPSMPALIRSKGAPKKR